MFGARPTTRCDDPAHPGKRRRETVHYGPDDVRRCAQCHRRELSKRLHGPTYRAE